MYEYFMNENSASLRTEASGADTSDPDGEQEANLVAPRKEVDEEDTEDIRDQVYAPDVGSTIRDLGCDGHTRPDRNCAPGQQTWSEVRDDRLTYLNKAVDAWKNNDQPESP